MAVALVQFLDSSLFLALIQTLTGLSRHHFLVLRAALRCAGWSVRQHFTKYERDDETGLDYAQARYYGSGTGRFASPDPLLSSGRAGIPQAWNRYSYTLNNPLIHTDPSGLYEWENSVGGNLSNAELQDLDKRLGKIVGSAYKDALKARKAFKKSLEKGNKAASNKNLTSNSNLKFFRQ